MISESEIREALSNVRQHRLSVFEFAEWLDSKSWGMHRDSSAEAVRLASSLERVLAEYDHHGDENVLRRELLSLIPDANVLEIHILIDAPFAQRVVIPVVPSSASSVLPVPELWVPELVAAGH